LKTEYVSMDTAARHLRTAVSSLPEAISRFQHATSAISAFGHLPEASKAKHTVSEAMKQLAQFGEDLHTEWTSEATALTTVADVLRRVDEALARKADGKG
jgi:hypothetical protein